MFSSSSFTLGRNSGGEYLGLVLLIGFRPYGYAYDFSTPETCFCLQFPPSSDLTYHTAPISLFTLASLMTTQQTRLFDLWMETNIKCLNQFFSHSSNSHCKNLYVSTTLPHHPRYFYLTCLYSPLEFLTFYSKCKKRFSPGSSG